MSEWVVRAAEASDREHWESLYRGYREFYEVAPGAPDWKCVRWTTHENNYRARRLYDQVAVRSEFLTYDMLID